MTGAVFGSVWRASFAGVVRQGAGLALVEVSIVKQRYHAVIEVLSSAVTDVVGRYEASRQTVHTWMS